MENKPIISLNCYFQCCYNPRFEAEIKKCKRICHKYNRLRPDKLKARQKILA